MSIQRKNHSSAFKAKVALEAVQGYYTLNEIATRNGIHPQSVKQWKSRLVGGATELFEEPGKKGNSNQEGLTNELYQQIGQLQMELTWLKKKSVLFR